jgi:hypothetical protein
MTEPTDDLTDDNDSISGIDGIEAFGEAEAHISESIDDWREQSTGLGRRGFLEKTAATAIVGVAASAQEGNGDDSGTLTATETETGETAAVYEVGQHGATREAASALIESLGSEVVVNTDLFGVTEGGTVQYIDPEHYRALPMRSVDPIEFLSSLISCLSYGSDSQATPLSSPSRPLGSPGVFSKTRWA